MAFPPVQPQDIFDLAGRILNGPTQSSTFATAANSSNSGTRQNQLLNERPAVNTRHIMRWLVPGVGVVEMYINPQNVSYNYKKTINTQRTKGGFVLQYWGEELTRLNISGTTGTSGIEGINVLHDIYRNEQIAFDPYALILTSQINQNLFSGDVSNLTSALNSRGNFLSSVLGISQDFATMAAKNSPTLASLAFTVELYWSGKVYRGFFETFSVTESANELGLFNYNIDFIVTQERGFRQNFLGWHRSATSGPVNSDPQTGTPYSFSGSASGG